MKTLPIISIATVLTVLTVLTLCAIQYFRVRRWRNAPPGYYRGADALYGLA